LSGISSVVAYYAADSERRGETFSLYWSEIVHWLLALVVLAPHLDIVGASMRQPGIVGLLVGLVGLSVQSGEMG
jgi:hypothetical protein